MNNEQKNNDGITPITPIQPQTIDSSATSAVQGPVLPVTNPAAVNIVSAPTPSSSNGGKIDVVNPVPLTGVGGDGKIEVTNPVPAAGVGGGLLMPSATMPEVKGAETSISNSVVPPVKNDNGSVATNASSPQLALENSSPFDIGVNAPINTNVSNNVQGTVSTIPVTGNANANTISSDINIKQSTTNSDIVTVGTYIKTMILFTIPVIGFIIMIIKALDKENKNISNFAKAYLLFGIIAFVLFFVLSFVLTGIGASMVGNGMY